jgi:mono/diheme cytochrome c family protein
MAKDAVKWLIISGMIFGLSATSWAQDLDAGKLEFQSGCAPCHGSDGKGKGPVSAQLKVAPADLTLLTKKNNGVFPVNSVYEVIDGRKQVEAHGTREMPIWGFRYMPSPYEAVNPSPATEAAIRARILAIVDYLNRIQEK